MKLKGAFRWIIVCAALLAGGFSLFAETVSQKEAMKLAETFFNTMYGEVSAPPKLYWNGRQLTTDRLFSPFYIYNHPKGGFVIISADNKAYPIFAYSKTVPFSRENLGENENQLLKKYAKEVELIRYDPRLPVNALGAWQNLPSYISKMVNTPYATDEYRALSEEQKENIETIDRKNSWIVMPSAVEYDIYDPSRYRDLTLDDITSGYIGAEEEEIPFSFYENFIKSIAKENEERERMLEELIQPTHPVVRPQGGAHFAIYLPEEASLMRVYSINGSMAQERYYKGVSTVNVNLEALPGGYYVGLVMCKDGKIFGFKLYR